MLLLSSLEALIGTAVAHGSYCCQILGLNVLKFSHILLLLCSLLAWAADGIVNVVEINSGTSLLTTVQPAEEMVFSPGKKYAASRVSSIDL